MRALREWIHRTWAAIRPSRRDSDLEEELRCHLELAAADAIRRSADSETGRRLARLHAGGVSQAMDALRDQRGVPLISGLSQDVRLASVRSAPRAS